jgi:hypothetical protein
MIVWLASYPRSGNTLLRTILNHVFGLRTYSIYDDPEAIGDSDAVSKIVGHVKHRLGVDDFVRQAVAAAEPIIVKTHEAPPDGSPAIYVVRDGRAATVSYWHYARDFQRVVLALEQVVLGDVFAGAWADHMLAWNPLNRPKTLLLRYEQLAVADPEAMAAIADFLGKKALGPFQIRFEDLHRLEPNFFRSGCNSMNIAELESACPELFWLRSGASMVKLGYAEIDPFAGLPTEQRTRLCDEISRSLKAINSTFAQKSSLSTACNGPVRYVEPDPSESDTTTPA